MSYSDYFALKEGYYSVISKYSIEDPKDRWQDTYPHANFIELLNKVARMLERPDKSGDRKPIWMHGAYGTGKSRFAWTLRELLRCDPAELDKYFDEYEELRRETELRKKFAGLKSGVIVATMRFASSDIDSLDKLVMAIYESVSAALEEKSLNLRADAALAGAVTKWLEDEVNRNILTQILGASPYRNNGSLPKSGLEVYNRLLEGKCDPAFLSLLLQIGRERHIQNLSFDVAGLCEWLKEVIELNNLKAIVLIWDEFSDFLYANRNLYGELQNLAQFSQSAPFYLLIITHFLEDLIVGADAVEKMSDRFNQHQITLPDNIAFKLIGHALKIQPDAKKEWNVLRDDLNDRLQEARRAVAKMVPGLDQEDFKKILPIHPYAALILKNVAQLFDSNQRSMFEFIAEDEDLCAFKWFIRKYGPEDAAILAIDQLWEYFYQSGKGKLGVGKYNLDAEARNILDAYPSLAGKNGETDEQGRPKDTPEQRVLKTVLILQALRKKSPQTGYFRANEQNLETAFTGVAELENGVGIGIAKSLVDGKKLFFDGEIYQVPLGHAIDQSEIQKLAEKQRNNISTSDLIVGFDPWEVLPASKALARRMEIEKTGARDFRTVLNRLANRDLPAWKIRALMLFARDPDEADQVREELQKALQNPRADNIYFIDATAAVFGVERFENYLLAMARSAFFAGKDSQQSKNERGRAESELNSWKSALGKNKFILYSAKRPGGDIAANGDQFVDLLKDFAVSLFPFCCDFRDGAVETHFNDASITAVQGGVKGGAGKPITEQNSAKLLADVRAPEYWKHSSDPLAVLKRELDSFIGAAFEPGAPGRISIGAIVDFLLERGFMPTALSAYLTGWLLKEYASPGYRYSDGVTGDVMSKDKLAEMIGAYFRNLNNPNKNYVDQYLEVLTGEQRAFADLAKNIFGLEGNESLESISSRIGDKVKNWNLPLWVLAELPEASGLEEYVNLFADFSNQSANASIATKIGKMIIENPHAEKKLETLFKRDSLEKGMRAWTQTFRDGEFVKLAAEIGVEDTLRDIRSCFEGDKAWLWNREIGEEELERLLQGYRLAAQSVRKGFLTSANSREACLAGWRQKLRGLRLPVDVLRERSPDQKALLDVFQDIFENAPLLPSKEQILYDAIINGSESLNDLFNNSVGVFKTVYANLLSSLGDKDVAGLYDNLSPYSFSQSREDYENDLKDRIRETASKLKRAQLCRLWEENSETKSPAELAVALQTPLQPILSKLFGEAKFEEALVACEAVNNVNASENEIAAALAFWSENLNEIAYLKDQSLADDEFKKVIGGNLITVVDLARIRRLLNERFGHDPWRWLDNPGWRKAVEDLAQAEYIREGAAKACAKIRAMSPEDARNLLLKLTKTSWALGLLILGEQ